jgi:Predicted transcriptional regulators
MKIEKIRERTDAPAQVLRQIRVELNLSQEEIGRRIQVDRAYVSALEVGRRYPSLDMLIAFAKAFEKRPGELLDRISERIDSGKAKPLKTRQAGPTDL